MTSLGIMKKNNLKTTLNCFEKKDNNLPENFPGTNLSYEKCMFRIFLRWDSQPWKITQENRDHKTTESKQIDFTTKYFHIWRSRFETQQLVHREPDIILSSGHGNIYKHAFCQKIKRKIFESWRYSISDWKRATLSREKLRPETTTPQSTTQHSTPQKVSLRLPWRYYKAGYSMECGCVSRCKCDQGTNTAKTYLQRGCYHVSAIY